MEEKLKGKVDVSAFEELESKMHKLDQKVAELQERMIENQTKVVQNTMNNGKCLNEVNDSEEQKETELRRSNMIIYRAQETDSELMIVMRGMHFLCMNSVMKY